VSRNAFVLAMILVVCLLGDSAAACAAHERWRRPLLGGAVVGSFTYERSAPYVGGRRRGIDLAGTPGARVVAACTGVVAYVGRVPGWGRGLSVRCGSLVATELGLSSTTVARGARVVAGMAVGRLASSGRLRLGARHAEDRQGYVDPLALLDGGGAPVTAPLAPAGRRGRGPAAPVVRLPGAVRAGAGEVALPWSVWAGLGLLAVGAGGGGAVRHGHRRRMRAGITLAQR
jgi:hypothetical protein